MQDNIIKKEIKESSGIYLIAIDKEKASVVTGENYSERVSNAIREFLDEAEKIEPIRYKLKGI
jgi:hypothetical protein